MGAQGEAPHSFSNWWPTPRCTTGTLRNFRWALSPLGLLFFGGTAAPMPPLPQYASDRSTTKFRDQSYRDTPGKNKNKIEAPIYFQQKFKLQTAL